MKTYALTILVGSALLSGVALAEQTKSVALIASPQTGQTVRKIDLVTIQMRGPGHPIVAVRSTEKGSHWWIQEAGTSESPDEYVIRARFGNDKTPTGSRFEVVTLIAPDAATAASIQPGTSMKQLPIELTLGEVNEVILNPDGSKVDTPTTFGIELLSPQSDVKVFRDQRVSVRLQEPTRQLPLLLVRSAEPNSPWWVQEPMEGNDDGILNGTARIGNEKTPTGSKFQLMFVIPKHESARQELKTGETLKDLEDFQCSKIFVLTRGNPDATADDPTLALFSP